MKKYLILIVSFCFLLAVVFGKTTIPLWNLIPDDHVLLFKIRLPHVILAFLAGSSLSLSGSVYQGLFKNNLAGPYTLGVASGASLGAFIAEIISFPYPFVFTLSGSLITILLVFFIPNMKRVSVSLNKFLLIGVCLSFIFSSLILFIQFSMSSFGLRNVMHFLLGDINIVGWSYIFYLAPISFLSLFTLFYFHRELSLIEICDNYAEIQGVEVKKVQYITILTSSILVAMVISFCGPIGFVGIIIPNIFRRYYPANFKEILIGSFFGGGIFLMLVDLLSRVILKEGNFPVGVLTSLIGGPLFLIMLLRTNRI